MHQATGIELNSLVSQRSTASNAPVSRLAVLTILLMTGCNQALADESCGPAEMKYVDEIAVAIQPFASRVTRSGRFETKEELSTNGTQVFMISFVDRGKTLFVHRVLIVDPILTPTLVSPIKKTKDNPGFTVALLQGRLGACEYDFFVQDAKFIISPQGLKH